ncbi:hypothetical protein FY534_13945 (plasmid) [Alicyclobacillus sp. TC]|uniref:Uncharacterized protein n=1 Tax=Alicyclobacillus tolerans TaxID=90970 RepID=A0ABT9LYP5_9BACL|nr:MULTISPECIES: hypothetical protein [Alicyclobacillus]MDP9729382.1 hypothetical protein [Alicyclobacillus tengchongensis]QRF24875.1 hypothetical protein FY534_13945 [Alicyclobacillus sp. TC]
MHGWMFYFSQWCHHMRAFLPWWGPIVLAFYTGYIFWVSIFPHRYTYMELEGRHWSMKDDMKVFGMKIGFFSLVVYYVLWFALPYPGTELLFDIFALPWLLIYLGIVFGVPLMEGFFLFFSYETKAYNSGMTRVEWEMYVEQKRRLQTRLKQEELTAWVRAHSLETSEEEVEMAAHDKRSRFKVIPGKRKRG